MTDEAINNSTATEKPSKRDAKSRRPGQVIKRGEDKWLIRIFLGRDTSGKRHYHSETFIGKKKKAEELMRGLLERKKLGEPLRQSEITFDQFLDQWLETVKLRGRERTWLHYANIAQRYVRPDLGKRRLIDVMAADVTALYTTLSGRGLSAATVRYVHTLLTNAFKLALRREQVRKNPMLGVDPPRKESRELQSLDADQMRAFLRAAEARHKATLFALAFYTGARPCEYLALKWSDLDNQAGAVTLQRSMVWRETGDWYLTEPKTAASRRTIPLSAPLLAKLSEHRKQQLEEKLRAGKVWENHGFIFSNEIGQPFALRAIRHVFKRLLKDAGLPLTTRLYDARHSCASALIASGINSKVVSERLGHSKVNITLDTYTHVSAGMQKEASDQLDKAIFG